MKFNTLLFTRYVGLATMIFFGSAANSQDILIGHVAGYNSAVKKEATGINRGASILFNAVNASGGINGRKLRIVVADDHYKAEETAKLITEMNGKVSALLPSVGSANIQYLLKNGTMDNMTLPMVGTIPSNESMRNPPHKNIFHFRAGDRDQIEKIVEHITGFKINNIAVIARKNPSSEEGVVLLQEALKKRGVELGTIARYEVTSKSFEPQVKLMQEKKPGAIVLLGNGLGIANVTKALRDAKVPALLYSVSYADFKMIVNIAGPQAARGFVISQVFPNLNQRANPLIKEFRERFVKYASATEEPTTDDLEGYVAAKLIVEAIRVSKDASAEGVKRGLEQLTNFDLGGYIINFSPTKHAGSNWVDLVMLGPNGTILY